MKYSGGTVKKVDRDAVNEALTGAGSDGAPTPDAAITAAVEGGESITILTAMRAKLGRVMDITESARDIAAISREIDKLTERIDALKAAQPGKGVSRRDEIAAAREARKAAAAG